MEKTHEHSDLGQISLLRSLIDTLDNDIAKLLLKRSRIVKQIHHWKKDHGLPVEDKVREEKILKRLHALYPEMNSETLSEIYQVIFSAHK